MFIKVNMKNKKHILNEFFHSIFTKIFNHEKNIMKDEFINDLNEQRENLATAVVELQNAKINKESAKKIQALEEKVCSINKNIIKDSEIFQVLFSYDPKKDKKSI